MAIPPRLQELSEKNRPGIAAANFDQRTPLHLLKIPILLVLFPAIWFQLGAIAWQLAQAWHPDLQGVSYLGSDFNEAVWQAGGHRTVGAMLLLLPLALPALGFTLVIANMFVACIRPIATVFEREAGSNPQHTLKGVTTRLMGTTFKLLLPVGVAISVIGALII